MWSLVAFSIPEDNRAARDALRLRDTTAAGQLQPMDALIARTRVMDD
jgi:hypothetical protein